METKKSKKADLESRRGMFLQIGLVVSLALAAAAFGYSKEKVEFTDIAGPGIVVEPEMIPVTTTPPEEVKPRVVAINVATDVINIVRNDHKVDNSAMNFDFDEDAIYVPKIKVEPEAEVQDIFIKVEKMPEFIGGDLNKFRKWVTERLKYPAVAAESNIYGRVVLSFVVERDGSLSNVEVLQTPDRSLSEEAERVLKGSPKWTPGMQQSKAVRVKYTLPVDFRMQN